jgi:hypothetical protein
MNITAAVATAAALPDAAWYAAQGLVILGAAAFIVHVIRGTRRIRARREARQRRRTG